MDGSLTRLSDEELLREILSGKGVENLIRENGNVYEVMLHTSAQQLKNVAGIGQANVRKVLSIRELFRRLLANKRNEVKQINGPDDIAEYFQFLKYSQQEEFWALLLDVKNRVIDAVQITKGTLTQSMVAPRELFNAAIKAMANTVAIAHNHPSGDPTPSMEDRQITEKLILTGVILDIPILDHVIVGTMGSYSFKRHDELKEVWK